MDLLPSDVLLKIFHRLDDSSLIVASEVCERWFNLITESPSIMKRFTLSITYQIRDDESFHVCEKIHSGNHQNIFIQSIKRFYALSKEFYEYIDKHRMTVISLILKDFSFGDLIPTINVFNLENITKLSLIECNCNSLNATPFVMPSLTHLELINSTEFINEIKIHRIKVLKILNRDNHMRTNTNILNLFLKSCVDLKELTLSNFNDHSTPLMLNINDLKFNLMSLTVESTIIDNLQQFLLSQKNSLESLAISCENQEFELMRVIFYELKLTKLETDSKIMPENFPKIAKNSTIKELILRQNIEDEATTENESNADIEKQDVQAREMMRCRVTAFASCGQSEEESSLQADVILFKKCEKIISICSAVESIFIIDFDLYVINFLTPIDVSMRKLKNLSLSTVPYDIPSDVDFQCLQTLEIDEIDDVQVENLISLIKLCRNLSVVKLNRVLQGVFNERFFRKFLKTVSYLREFHIGYVSSSQPIEKLSLESVLRQNGIKNFNLYEYLSSSSIVDELKLGGMEREMRKLDMQFAEITQQ